MATSLRPHAPRSSEGGFTLIEMVVAISVLAVVALALARVTDSGLRALAASKARAQGNDIATQGIEDLQRFSFNNLGFCGGPPSGTAPAGLEETVGLSNCAGTVDYEEPCTGDTGSVPRAEYTCLRNNVTYTVKRWIAWSDAAKTAKRLAVFVEWDDLTGRHQVSQQSSLRAPDQAAITGLLPPTFTTGVPPAVSPATVTVDGGQLTGPLTLRATTTNLSGPASTTLTTAVATHSPNQNVVLNVSSATGFPTYNGFTITAGGEAFKVVAGAGTLTWTATATGSAAIGATQPVTFAGDRVYATFQTIGSNGSPRASTVSLGLVSTGSGTTANWERIVMPSDGYTWGSGWQYVSFGILRAADGKSTSAVATPALQVCPVGGCTGIVGPTFSAATAPTGTITIGTSGDLASDVTVRARTTYVSSADTVSVTFLTQSGSVTMNLGADPDTAACPDIATITAADTCHWVGTITRASGYRFPTGDQYFYFAAQQVTDADPATIDKGSTGVADPVLVRFGS